MFSNPIVILMGIAWAILAHAILVPAMALYPELAELYTAALVWIWSFGITGN